jgi:hypothetical protein
MPDYPAAHSMDTAWFAVDKEGHLAYFDTGESGAIPINAVGGDEAFELRDRLVELLPRCEVLYDPRGRQLPGEPPGPMPEGSSALVFLSSLAPAQADIEAGRATAVRATEGYAVLYRPLTPAQARRLQDSGAVVASSYHFDDPDMPPNLAGFGIYEYGHLCDNWIAGPYGREEVPTRRVHVDQLPPGLRRSLKSAVLPGVSFAETPILQPLEHGESESWEPAWLSTDGVIRAVPGRADDYRQLYDELRVDMPQYRFEPPSEE